MSDVGAMGKRKFHLHVGVDLGGVLFYVRCCKSSRNGRWTLVLRARATNHVPGSNHVPVRSRKLCLQFLACNKLILVVDNPPFSRYLAPCDFKIRLEKSFSDLWTR